MLKICSHCGVEKPTTEFTRHKLGKGGLNPRCKPCKNYLETARRAPLRECVNATETARRSLIRDRLNAQSKEYYRRIAKERGYLLAADSRLRQCVKAKCAPPWLTDDHKTFIEIAYGMAAELGKTHGIKFEVDHIHPIQGEKSCGLHVPWNIQVMPAFDNKSKGNRLVSP